MDRENTKKFDLAGFLNKKISRHNFLGTIKAMAGVLTGIGLTGFIPFGSIENLSSEINTPPFVKSSFKALKYPFKLGVASGDPLPDGVVLWTRLAPDLNGGKMPSKPIEVNWEMAEDESFSNVIKQGTDVAEPEYAHSVHAEVDGLEPDRWYYYRFKLGNEISRTGRTKTAPARGDSVDQLNFAFASCQNFKEGYFTAYDHLINEDIDLVFFLGDYIYEYGGQGNLGRGHIPEKEVTSLDEYRTRHAQYKTDSSLQAAHAAFPWIVTLDDHEIKNDWGGKGPPYDDNEQFLARRAAALQAYYEHMPLRKTAIPDDIDMQLYRSFRFGDLVEFNVLDTRQYRTDFACSGRLESECSERFDPSRTMLGKEQEEWLFNNLKSSSSHWDVIAQQVMVAQRDRKKGSEVGFHMDKWDGYVSSRNRLFDTIENNRLSDVIVLTGDQHSNWASNLKKDFNDKNSPVLATEFVGTSISSGGNGTDIGKKGRIALTENEHVKFFNAQRGYVRCSLTPDRWKTDFRIVSYVDKSGADIETKASFIVENGHPGVIQI